MADQDDAIDGSVSRLQGLLADSCTGWPCMRVGSREASVPLDSPHFGESA